VSDAFIDLDLPAVLEELSKREPIFHHPEFGDFEYMMVDDYWEVGASGRCYSRSFVLEELARRQLSPQPDVWETMDFRCRKLAPDVYLLTYTLIQDHQRRTRRSTLWQRTGEDWKIIYHQGTIIQEE